MVQYRRACFTLNLKLVPYEPAEIETVGYPISTTPPYILHFKKIEGAGWKSVGQILDWTALI